MVQVPDGRRDKLTKVGVVIRFLPRFAIAVTVPGGKIWITNRNARLIQ
jgi:hypothetical protein